ncbi:carbohydrate kinase family protein [Bacillus kwashiorkori]|uniref:carbohydrate kinase family protein n=1 Tax=Bacillus kwashiorkori TaxID=1522318 RepID=UPI000B085320|nr:carbohydrate kinase [Bacillus kwashiorkori]
MKVTALGEILIDFTPEGKDEHGNPILVANPGGAPGNVLVALSNLGFKTNFIGSVGRDQFGNQLVSTLKEKNVGVEGIVYSDINTTLAFVHVDDKGDRSFSFYRNPGADMMLTKENVNVELIKNSNVFHVGSISMTNEPSREATLAALKYAKKNNVVVSYDPNLRPPLWEDLEEAKAQILNVMEYADIVKVSEEELEFLTGHKDLEAGALELYNRYNLTILFVTMGEKGSCLLYKSKWLNSAGIKVKAVDTTGCGDAFFAGVLFHILTNHLLERELENRDLEQLLEFGNIIGSYVALKNGGIPAMPTLSELEAYRESLVNDSN